jgi:hypothetical protein
MSEMVSLRDYVDAINKEKSVALALALENVKVSAAVAERAAERAEKKQSGLIANILAGISLLFTVALAVYTLAKH